MSKGYKPEIEMLMHVCAVMGYGATMHEAAKLYKQWDLIRNDARGSNFVVGPCDAMVVPCECDVQHKCKWCCGCGWLTQHVKAMKDSEGE